MENKRKVGSEREQIAAKYLSDNGLHIIEMNFRCRIGEIDLVARDQNDLVFVEVKYRKSTATGYPEEAVDYRKMHKICRVSDYYRVKYHIPSNTNIRYDVVAILQDQITWHKNAFPYC